MGRKKSETLLKDADIKKGAKVNESLIANTRNYITNKYRKDGYLNTKVTIDTKVDTTDANGVDMLIHIDKGSKVKVDKIVFEGNQQFSSSKLRKKLKKTKQIQFGRFWKRSKYVKKNYEEDLTNLIDFYKEKGYRDARVVSDSLIKEKDGNVSLKYCSRRGQTLLFR